jgi:Endonuclease-reverse transcriptase
VTIKLTIKEIQTTIEDATCNLSKAMALTLAGDFNRHHPAWSGN